MKVLLTNASTEYPEKLRLVSATGARCALQGAKDLYDLLFRIEDLWSRIPANTDRLPRKALNRLQYGLRRGNATRNFRKASDHFSRAANIAPSIRWDEDTALHSILEEAGVSLIRHLAGREGVDVSLKTISSSAGFSDSKIIPLELKLGVSPSKRREDRISAESLSPFYKLAASQCQTISEDIALLSLHCLESETTTFNEVRSFVFAVIKQWERLHCFGRITSVAISLGRLEQTENTGGNMLLADLSLKGDGFLGRSSDGWA